MTTETAKIMLPNSRISDILRGKPNLLSIGRNFGRSSAKPRVQIIFKFYYLFHLGQAKKHLIDWLLLCLWMQMEFQDFPLLHYKHWLQVCLSLKNGLPIWLETHQILWDHNENLMVHHCHQNRPHTIHQGHLENIF